MRALNRLEKNNFSDYDVYDAFEKVNSKTTQKLRTISLYQKIGAVAALFICFFIGYSYSQYQGDDVFYQVYKTLEGENSIIELPDGTEVFLNENTKIEVASDFSPTNRNLKLEGEAYFEVKHNPSSIFTVVADKYKLRVLGTKFNLSAYKEKNIIASLIKGKVEVDLQGFSLGKKMMKPKQNLIFNPYTKEVKLNSYEHSSSIDWKKHKLMFDNLDFQFVINDLSIYYNIDIELESDRLKFEKLTGNYKNKSIEQILNSFKRILDFNIKYEDSKIVLQD